LPYNDVLDSEQLIAAPAHKAAPAKKNAETLPRKRATTASQPKIGRYHKT